MAIGLMAVMALKNRSLLTTEGFESIGELGSMGDESWLYWLRTDGGVVFHHSGR